MRDFDGGSCFLARPLGAASDSIAIQGIGSDKATFERFYVEFIKAIGVEPALTVRLIGAAECPAVDLIRAGGDDRSSAPKIDLAGYDVGRGKPLAGTVVNLAGRRLDLLLVSSDGQVYRLDAHTQPGGQTAAFSVPITPDAASIEALQLLLAIASPRSSPALEGFKTAAASDILPRLRSQLSDAAATLDVEFFKLVK
jgi:serine/threonine-protein kinase